MTPNFQPLVDTVFNGVFWFIPVLLVITALKLLFTARLKGAAGERRVNKALNTLSLEVLHDIVIPDGRGGWTQLDHVALTPAGLLMIETKNYKGGPIDPGGFWGGAHAPQQVRALKQAGVHSPTADHRGGTGGGPTALENPVAQTIL